jgi:hypothetical protein
MWSGVRTNSGGKRDQFGQASFLGSVFDPTKPRPKTIACRDYTDASGNAKLDVYESFEASNVPSTGQVKITFKNLLESIPLSKVTETDPDRDGLRHRRLTEVLSEAEEGALPPLTIPSGDAGPQWQRTGEIAHTNSVRLRGDGVEGIYVNRVRYSRQLSSGQYQSAYIYRVRAMPNLHNTTDYYYSGWMSLARSRDFEPLLLAYQQAVNNAETVIDNVNWQRRSAAQALSAGVVFDSVAQGYASGGKWTEFSKPWVSVALGACSAAILYGQGQAAKLSAHEKVIKARNDILAFIRARWPTLYNAPL